VSRTRRAGITAVFGYAQFALALVSGIALVPFILSRIPNDHYGVWLAFGEVLAYSSMVDLGVVGVIPWLLAEHDGRGDRDAIRGLLAAGVVFSTVAAALFAGLALLAFHLAPSVANVTLAQRAAVLGPVLFLVAATALTMPLRTFYAALIGLQDATFTGFLAVAQVGVNVALTLGLLLAGQGLYALAAATSVPGLLASLASVVRLRIIAPELLRGWRFPSAATLRSITAQGFGSWTAGLGWRMVAASDSIIILNVLGPAAAVVYAMTFKLGTVGMQMSWQLPDSGLVGLAQLKGDGRPERVREITVQLIRMVLITSGGVACAIAAFNPSFVTLWVGPARFGGLALNAMLAAVILSHSLAHGLFTTSATLGTRVQAGWAALAQGAVNLGAAIVFGRLWGLAGIAFAAVISTALVAYPAGVWMVRRTTGLSQGELWRRALGPWSARAAVLLVLGFLVSAAALRGWIWLPLPLAPFLGVLYLWAMRPLYAGMPLPARVRPLLTRLRLVAAE
jgi:O-antigen/teichoic acid export membrane protein